MSQMGHSRLGEASWRSNHVGNAPLATVGLKKAACREGPMGDTGPNIIVTAGGRCEGRSITSLKKD